MRDWYLISTKHGKEDLLQEKFRLQQFEVLNPKISERKILRRKLQDVVSPLFPCYLFVKFDFPSDYCLVKYTRGVKSIVGANHPVVVPDEIITSIVEKMDGGMIKMKAADFVPGEKVLIKNGSFKGLEAVFEAELKGSERVSILLKSINARVIIDRAMLAVSS